MALFLKGCDMAKKKCNTIGCTMRWSDTSSQTVSAGQARLQGYRFLAAARAEGFTGLKLAVHENLGWHFKLCGQNITFYPDSGGKIVVLAGGGPSAGRMGWSLHRNFTSFAAAWRAILKVADAEIDELRRIREQIDREKM